MMPTNLLSLSMPVPAAASDEDDARMDAISCVLCGDSYQSYSGRTPCILPYCLSCVKGSRS